MAFILRVVVHEERWESQLVDILSLCNQTGIQEIMLMEQSHQIQMTPFPLSKHKRMSDIYCKIAKVLRDNNIRCSVNIATLVGHADASFSNAPQFQFTRLVGEDLKERQNIFCILDDDWQKYAADVCALYANCEPDKLMIDDDFRSLNHTVSFGCFCKLHVKETMKICEMELTTHSLFSHLCVNDSDSLRVREAWMKANFNGQKRAARRIREAVHNIDPKIQIGLMTSGECAHSFQGRNMTELLFEFAGDINKPIARPAGGTYRDSLYESVIEMHQLPALSIYETGSNVHIVSEVENWPHTPYTKSIQLTKLQMQLHALSGADDLTLNLFDYLATPYALSPKIIKMIKDIKPNVEKITGICAGKELIGVGRPWKRDIARKMVNRTGKIDDLLPNRIMDNILPLLGIPVQFSESEINFICGDEALAFTQNEIESLLQKGLMLDNIAAEHICAMGFARYIGCEPCAKLLEPTVERMSNINFSDSYYDSCISTNWFRIQTEGLYMTMFKLLDGAFSCSDIEGDEGSIIAPATILFENELRGRVCVFAVPPSTATWCFPHRAQQVRRILEWISNERILLPIINACNIAPFCYWDNKENNGVLALINCSLDEEYVELPPDYSYTDIMSHNPVHTAIIPPVSAIFLDIVPHCNYYP